LNFITEDSSRDDLVAHVYDVTYGVIKPTDNLVIIDDSIVRGAPKMSIIKMMDRLNQKNYCVSHQRHKSLPRLLRY
jgi:amidophosphoribosyltransferase